MKQRRPVIWPFAAYLWDGRCAKNCDKMHGTCRVEALNIATVFAAFALFALPLTFAQEPARQRVPQSPPHHRPNDIGWNLAPEDQKYAAIDGNHLMEFVKDQTAIARHFRDNGHPQYWGRITGTEADADNAEWDD